MERWKEGGDTQRIMASSQLMESLGSQVDGVNLLEIEAYLKKSKIARESPSFAVTLDINMVL